MNTVYTPETAETDFEVCEKTDLWQYLKASNKPIYIYGMGDGAIKIMKALNDRQIPLSGVYASDEYVRGHSFCGFKVMRLSEVKALHGIGFISLLAFATQREPLLSALYEKSESFENGELFAPDVPVCEVTCSCAAGSCAASNCAASIDVFDMKYLNENAQKLNRVYSLLEDELSRETFCGLINFKLSGKLEYLKRITSHVFEAYSLISPKRSDCYVDLGGYNGDTILEFLRYAEPCEKGREGRIIAFEPDEKNLEKLKKNTADIFPPVEAFPYAAWSKKETLLFSGGKGGRNSTLSPSVNKPQKQVLAYSVDDLLRGEAIRPGEIIVKLDVEGAEGNALEGLFETIARLHPRIMLSAYHKNEDLFELPLKLSEKENSFKLYLRHHPYIPAWESSFYIVFH